MRCRRLPLPPLLLVTRGMMRAAVVMGVAVMAMVVAVAAAAAAASAVAAAVVMTTDEADEDRRPMTDVGGDGDLHRLVDGLRVVGPRELVDGARQQQVLAATRAITI